MRKLLIMGILCVLLLAGIGTVSANLVVNGNFDASNPVNSFDNINSGLPGWTIVGNIDHIGSYWTANSLPNSIDLAGTAQEGTIIQNIPTVSTKKYDLSFALAGNPDDNLKIKKVAVSWNGAPVTGSPFSFDTTGKSHANMGWTTESISGLQGSAGSTTELRFVDVTADGTSWGAALDDIVVEESNNVPVPEFPSIALPIAFIVGLIGAVLFVQKSKDQ